MYLNLDKTKIGTEPTGGTEGRVTLSFFAHECDSLAAGSMARAHDAWSPRLQAALATSEALARWRWLSESLAASQREHTELVAMMAALQESRRKALRSREGIGQVEKKLLAAGAQEEMLTGRLGELQVLLTDAEHELREEARAKLEEIVNSFREDYQSEQERLLLELQAVSTPFLAYLVNRVNMLALTHSVQPLQTGLRPNQPGLPVALLRLLEQVKPIAEPAQTV
jgi:hypothetical protein